MKIVKVILLICMSLILFVSITAAILWFNLGSLATSENLLFLQKHWIPQLSLDWSKVNIQIKNQGLLMKIVNLEGNNFCIRYKKTYICLEKLEARLEIHVIQKNWLTLHTLNISGTDTHIIVSDIVDTTKNTGNKVTSLQSIIEQVKSIVHILGDYRPESLHIKLLHQKVIYTETAYTIQFQTDQHGFDIKVQDSKLVTSLSGSFLPTLKNLNSIQGSFEINHSKFDITSNWKYLNNIPASIEAETAAVLHYHSSPFSKVSLNTHIQFFEQQTSLDFKKIEVLNSKKRKVISISQCEVNIKKNSDLHCPKILLNPTAFIPKYKTHLSKAQINQDISLQFQAHLKEGYLFSEQIQNGGYLEVLLQKIDNQLLTIQGHCRFNLKKNKIKLYASIDQFVLDLKIKSFQKLVEILRSMTWAVPAPLNQLSGQIKLQANSIIYDQQKKIQIPFSGHVDLQGPAQIALNLSLKGRLLLAQKAQKNQKTLPHLDLNVGIQRAYFYLPPFDPIFGLPVMNSDPRINKNKEAKQKKITFSHHITIETLQKDSIRFFYKHFDPYFPSTMHAEISNKGAKFDIRSQEKWTLTYLKRHVRIIKLEVKKAHLLKDKINIQAHLLYQAAGYDIYIDIFGDIEKPELRLSSFPNLSKSDIISVLLYNRTSDKLGRYESESSGAAKHAIEDRALGLFSIWALASTPIESFSYDSKKQMYSAQIALPGHINFNIGTDWEKVQNLSFRKRLSNTWALVTSYEPGQSEKADSGNMYLQKEWFY